MMQRAFRKLRKKLLGKENFRKYLVYALGEILLVMIGILLAIQVNNLNERIKNRKEEQQILKTLHTEFRQNIIDLEKVMRSHEATMVNINNVLSKYSASKEFHSSKEVMEEIRNAVFGKTYDPKFGILHSVLNTEKINLILDDSLRNSLAGIPGALEDYSEDEELAVQTIYNFYLPEIFKIAPDKTVAAPYSLFNYLEFLVPIIQSINGEGNELLTTMEQISRQIEAEIKD